MLYGPSCMNPSNYNAVIGRKEGWICPSRVMIYSTHSPSSHRVKHPFRTRFLSERTNNKQQLESNYPHCTAVSYYRQANVCSSVIKGLRGNCVAWSYISWACFSHTAVDSGTGLWARDCLLNSLLKKLLIVLDLLPPRVVDTSIVYLGFWD